MKFLISKPKQPHELLNHILDHPDLPDIIQHLDAGVLIKLIRHIGLEDSAQIVSLASTDQLKGIFDEDLWHSKTPGQAEAFDSERFGLWLEVMLESGTTFTASKILELDEGLVTLGLCRLVLVVGIDDLAMRLRDEWKPDSDDILENVLGSALSQSFDSYLVLSKNDTTWDAVCAILMELNELDYDFLMRLLGRCRQTSGECIEDNGGLFNVLTEDEMLEEDVAADREERKEGKGFVTPTSAAAFLSQARSDPLKKIIATPKMAPAARAYFKAAEAELKPDLPSRTGDKPSDHIDSESINIKVVRFIQTLQNAEVLPASDYKMIDHDDAGPWDHHLPLAKAMDHINQTDPDLYTQLLTELYYLSNTLIAGCGFQERIFQPKEAAEAAFSVCNLGSEILPKTDTGPEDNMPAEPLTKILKTYRLVKLFQVGWKILFDNVVLYTAKRVLEFFNILKDKQMDPHQVHEIIQAAYMLHACISSGRPWEFSNQMDYLQIFLGGETTMAITGLLQEYPTLTKGICNMGGHRESPFIWSKSHIQTIRHFLAKVL
ncbi:MAG: hypothetical protein KJ737_01540 [Proteobacteria bacterium]|nr:hypothetical protein [Pseudomonadota bacterium]